MPGPYQVPGEVFLAVTTSRVEFLQAFRNRIEKGEGVSKQDALAILDLLTDAVKQRDEDAHKAALLMRRLDNVQSHFAGLPGMFERAEDVAKAIRDNTAVEDT